MELDESCDKTFIQALLLGKGKSKGKTKQIIRTAKLLNIETSIQKIHVPIHKSACFWC